MVESLDDTELLGLFDARLLDACDRSSASESEADEEDGGDKEDDDGDDAFDDGDETEYKLAPANKWRDDACYQEIARLKASEKTAVAAYGESKGKDA